MMLTSENFSNHFRSQFVSIYIYRKTFWEIYDGLQLGKGSKIRSIRRTLSKDAFDEGGSPLLEDLMDQPEHVTNETFFGNEHKRTIKGLSYK